MNVIASKNNGWVSPGTTERLPNPSARLNTGEVAGNSGGRNLDGSVNRRLVTL